MQSYITSKRSKAWLTKLTFTLHVNEALKIERIDYLIYTEHRLYFPFVAFQLNHVHVLSVNKCTFVNGSLCRTNKDFYRIVCVVKYNISLFKLFHLNITCTRPLFMRFSGKLDKIRAGVSPT